MQPSQDQTSAPAARLHLPASQGGTRHWVATHGISSSYHRSATSRLQLMELMQRTAAIIGVPLSRVIELAENPLLEPHVTSIPVCFQSGPGPSWTPDQLATLERAAEAMGVSFSRLIRFAEDSAQPGALPMTSDIGGDVTTAFEDHNALHRDLTQTEDVWYQVGPSPLNFLSVELGPSSFGHQIVQPAEILQVPLDEEDSWQKISRCNSVHEEPFPAVGLTKGPSHDSYFQASSSESDTSHEPKFTPLHSSRGSPVSLFEDLGTSNAASHGQSSSHDVEHPTWATEIGQTLDDVDTRSAAALISSSEIWPSNIKQSRISLSPAVKAISSPFPRQRSHDSVDIRKRLQKLAKRGGKQNEKSRQVFSFGGCLQCSRKKKQCSLGVTASPDQHLLTLQCDKCANVRNPQSRLGCVASSLKTVVLYRRTTDMSNNKPYKELIRSEALLQPVLSTLRSAGGPLIGFRVSQGPADLVLSTTTFDQRAVLACTSPEKRTLYTHPYALQGDPKRDVELFFRKRYGAYLNHYLRKERCELDMIIFQAAAHESRNYSKDSSETYRKLIRAALHFWAAARSLEGGWMFTPDQQLGLQGARGEPAALTMAPFIDYQMSAILMDILDPMRVSLLDSLERLARQRDPSHWYTVFLVTYILMHSYGLLAKQQARFARGRGLTMRFPQTHLIVDLQVGSQLLLSYLRIISRDKTVTEIDWPNRDKYKSIANLSDNQIEVMTRLSKLIKDNNMLDQFKFSTMSEHQHRLDDDYYFTGQIFVILWDPPSPLTRLPSEPSLRDWSLDQ